MCKTSRDYSTASLWNIKTVSDQATQRYLDRRMTIVPNNLLIRTSSLFVPLNH
ncbi:13659_t:CDS:2 [Funneliformis geosporum]|nr:13659_t:CDS:2 [Funneliformis geosporum]